MNNERVSQHKPYHKHSLPQVHVALAALARVRVADERAKRSHAPLHTPLPLPRSFYVPATDASVDAHAHT